MQPWGRVESLMEANEMKNYLAILVAMLALASIGAVARLY